MKNKGQANKNRKECVEQNSKKEKLRRIKETEDIYEILTLTIDEDDDVRLAAASQLCPCKVLDDIEEFWTRVFQMVDDKDVRIRARILHIICDGSPQRLRMNVMEALEKFNHDSDPEIRRTAHKVLAKAAKGTWNIL